MRRDILEEIDGPMLRHGLQELNGRSIHLPHYRKQWPKQEYLAQRFDEFRAA